MVSPIIKRYLLAVQRYKWAGLACLLSILGASGVVALQPPPPVEYYAEGMLVDNSPLVSLTNTADTIDQLGRGIISEDQLLPEVLLQVVSQQLMSQGITLSPDEIRRNTTIDVNGDKDEPGVRAEVRFIHKDPETATTVLNALFEEMINLSRVRNKARLEAIIDALNERLPPIESALRQAENELEQYDRNQGPAIQAAEDGSLLGQISGGRQQRLQNEITIEDIKTEIITLQQRLGMTPDEAYVSSALSADPIIANLRVQLYGIESQRRQLKASGYRDSHPAVTELDTTRQTLEEQLGERIDEVIPGLRGQLASLPRGTFNINQNLDPARAALANQLIDLEREFARLSRQNQTLANVEQDLRRAFASLPNLQLERERLANQVGLKKLLYDQIQARIVDAEAAEAETVSSLTVASPPTAVVNEPEKPNPVTILLVGGILGLVAGGGVIFLLDMLDGTIRTPEDLEKLLRDQDMPILGAVPMIRTRPAKAAPILVQSDSQYHSSYERCLSKLRLTGFEDSVIGPRVVLVTSTIANEGKSISAYNLAIAAAQAGRRTLLVEADLRSGSKAQYLGLVNDERVKLEPLRYYGGSLGDNIRMVPFIENLYVAPSPGPQRQAAAILESSEMRRFLDDARERFDMVILDTPSLSRVDDALLLEGQTDGMILVARPGVTERAVLNTALEELDLNEDISLLGVLINGSNVTLQDDEDDLSDDDDYLLEEETHDTPRPVAAAPVDF